MRAALFHGSLRNMGLCDSGHPDRRLSDDLGWKDGGEGEKRGRGLEAEKYPVGRNLIHFSFVKSFPSWLSLAPGHPGCAALPPGRSAREGRAKAGFGRHSHGIWIGSPGRMRIIEDRSAILLSVLVSYLCQRLPPSRWRGRSQFPAISVIVMANA